jgi:hypothetical protein
MLWSIESCSLRNISWVLHGTTCQSRTSLLADLGERFGDDHSDLGGLQRAVSEETV